MGWADWINRRDNRGAAIQANRTLEVARKVFTEDYGRLLRDHFSYLSIAFGRKEMISGKTMRRAMRNNWMATMGRAAR